MKKNIERLLFIVISFAILIAYLFYKEGIQSIENLFALVNPIWIIAAMISVLCANVCTATILTILLKKYTDKKTFFKNLRNDLVANMLGVVTPFSSGNIAYQIAKMTQDFEIDAGDSSAIMLKRNVFYQGSFILAIIVFIFTKGSYSSINSVLWIAILISLVANVLILLFYLLVPKAEKTLTNAACAIIGFLGRTRILKNPDETKDSATKNIHKLRTNMNMVKTSKIECLFILVVSLMQHMFLFQTSFFIYKAMDLSGCNYLTVICSHSLCNLIQTSIPIPGGLGVADYAFNNILKPIMGQYIDYAMVLWRLITFYWPIIIGLLLSLNFRKK